MKVLNTVKDVRGAVAAARAEGKTVGLVPTMGALHEGHMTLVRNAKAVCDFVVVSVFVNPTQFGPTEDFDKYPRTLAADAEKCEKEGVDVIFAPSPAEMYPEGYDAWVTVGGVTEVLEGEARPTHFRGVTTVCTKLFNITGADKAFFGRKDYQQLCVIKKNVRDLNLNLEIVPVDIVRDTDGLALSSRNKYLSDEERKAALCLSRSLKIAKKMYKSGSDLAEIKSAVTKEIEAEPLMKIDYVALVDRDTLRDVTAETEGVVLLLAAYAGATRLIDNTLL